VVPPGGAPGSVAVGLHGLLPRDSCGPIADVLGELPTPWFCWAELVRSMRLCQTAVEGL
jgi:hypothetical protein